MALNRVVLPAPLEPSTARRSPAWTARLMSARATSAPKWRLTASSSSAKRPVLCRRERASVSDKLDLLAQAFHSHFGDRKSVVEGKSVSVRVDRGGRGILKK